MADLINMADQFSGLPMESLIGGPLQAACKAEVMLAAAVTNFIEVVGFEDASEPNTPRKAKTVSFSFTRPATDPEGKSIGSETVSLDVPVLSVVNMPSLMISQVDVTFDMEVKSSSASQQTTDKSGDLTGSAKLGWGIFSLDVNIKGSVSSHESNTRSSDNSAKYHVEVHAQQAGVPEGLSRVLDILSTAVQPTAIASNAKPQEALPAAGGSRPAQQQIQAAETVEP